MRRREFITLLGGAATVGCWPLTARAQQTGRLPTVGFLVANAPAVARPWLDAFERRLRELGWTESRTVAIEYRWAEGRPERAAEILAEFVRLNVAVIVTSSTPNIIAAKKATSAIPIVFAASADPVGAGLVESLSRPGGNVTGLSLQQTDTAAKRLELLREVVPRLRRLAIMVNADNPASVLEMREVEAAARALGLEAAITEYRNSEGIAAAIESVQGRAEALYVCNDPLTANNPVRVSLLAITARLPTIHIFREHVEAGGLMSYGASMTDLHARSADFVDKILHGAKPGELPVQQPVKFDLVFNQTTAKALGLEIPSRLLFTADQVIE
jgi:putative ABC transport system substrate-binding protein